MKKIMSIIIMVTFVLAQSGLAAAFVSDGTAGPFAASADLSTGTPVATLTVEIKNLGDDTDATAIAWSSVILGDGWKKADQYLRVYYDANQIGWGVQIYTDNMAATANPRYTGSPTTDPNQQPAGLIGVQNTRLTCPMTTLVTDAVVSNPGTNIVIPVEATTGTPGQANYSVYFTTGYDQVAGGAHEKVWFWLKDKSGTRWNDADNDGVIDTGELVSNFSATGDDYATIVNTMGSSSGWVSATSGLMQRDSDSASPIIVYLAAKFSSARELQEYKTNTLALELYHQ